MCKPVWLQSHLKPENYHPSWGYPLQAGMCELRSGCFVWLCGYSDQILHPVCLLQFLSGSLMRPFGCYNRIISATSFQFSSVIHYWFKVCNIWLDKAMTMLWFSCISACDALDKHRAVFNLKIKVNLLSGRSAPNNHIPIQGHYNPISLKYFERNSMWRDE